MGQRFFIFDPARCFGCHACTVACKMERGLPAQVTWRRVGKLPPHAGASNLQFISSACCHCADPECLKHCPARAYVKRASDGVVLHLEHRCIGCRYCTLVCPYGIPQFDETRGIVTKCDFCVERLDEGKPPLCIETCFAGALDMVVLEDGQELPEGCSRQMEGFPEIQGVVPSVLFKTGSSGRTGPAPG
jgi:Fe-S-cluster-containing dehydrogenase component